MGSGKNILLIEDDKYIALALKIRLQAEGYAVTVVYDCATALQSVNDNVPDVALIDCNLPDGNGIEVMQCFAAHNKTTTIAPIIMTASNKPGLRDEAMAAGAFSYFQKPFNSADLVAAINCATDHVEYKADLHNQG